MIVVSYKTKLLGILREKTLDNHEDCLDLITQPDVLVMRIIVNGTGFTETRYIKTYHK